MTKGKGKKSPPLKQKSFYPLDEVKLKVAQGKIYFTRNALARAFDDFGWGSGDICNALSKLQPKHFDKTSRFEKNISMELDYYKASGINGENIFTHFYIDDEAGLLIINSFHALEG